MRVLLLLLPSLYFTQSTGSVGINTISPTATLDVSSSGNTDQTKAFRISNSESIEIITVQNNGNIGVNSPLSSNNTSQFNINAGSPDKSVLAIRNLSDTREKSVPNINYNNFSTLAIDENGNILKQFDIRTTNPNAVTFDGSYTATSTNSNLITLFGGGIVSFQILTPDFSLGNGDILYASITWSRNGGFAVSDYGYENLTGTNPMTVNGEGTHSLVFNFTNGLDLQFTANLNGSVGANVNIGTLGYNVNGSGSVPFDVYYSFRSR